MQEVHRLHVLGMNDDLWDRFFSVPFMDFFVHLSI